jgi:2-methylcitrate dehydratase PrpD
VLSGACDAGAITDPSTPWEILNNSYKPFACGLVVHPVIDGCIRLRQRHGLTAQMIEGIEVVVHPRVMEVTAIREPETGLAAKFSVYHAAAVAIAEGAAGEREFSDAMARAPHIAQLRRQVAVAIDGRLGKAQARVTIRLKSGALDEVFVEHALGSVQNPMSDRMIEDKFRSFSDAVLRPGQAEQILDLCRGAEKLADAGDIARSTAGA